MKPASRFLVLAVRAAALLACGAGLSHAQSDRAPLPAVQQREADAADRHFMVLAAQAGHAEVAAGRLAADRGSDPSVRDYGRMLVEDHQRANTRLVAIAHERGIVLPTGPSPGRLERLRRLERLDGAAFDREFLQRMLTEHRSLVAMFREQAGRKQGDAALRRYALEVLPTLQAHLQRAEGTHARLREALASRQAAAGQDGAQHAAARALVRDAVQVVQKMKADPRVAQLLRQAHGVFIVPAYGRAALGLGGQGGAGVLVARQGGQGFGHPAFYDLAGLSIGVQAGAAVGEVAFLLMTERAVQHFRSDRRFSLNFDAGLAIANYSARSQASSGKLSDVIAWSDTEGAYAGLSAGVTNILADAEANRAYYGRPDATPLAILGGQLEDPYGNALGRVLGI